MTWVKTLRRPKSSTPLHFPNSNSIVSCPGFSSWDFETPCSLIFHYGNMLPQRKWGCSAQHHTHQLNLNSVRGQKEDQTWLTVERWPHEFLNDRRWEKKGDQSVAFLTLFVSSRAGCLGTGIVMTNCISYSSFLSLRCAQCGQTVYISVGLVWSQKDHSNPVSLHCQTQTGWMTNEVILAWVCVCVFSVIRHWCHTVLL